MQTLKLEQDLSLISIHTLRNTKNTHHPHNGNHMALDEAAGNVQKCLAIWALPLSQQ